MNLEEIVWVVLLLGLITFVFLFDLSLIFPGDTKYIYDETSIKCCNGSYCSDTYYSSKDNLCHLARCESNFFSFNKSKCLYNPT